MKPALKLIKIFLTAIIFTLIIFSILFYLSIINTGVFYSIILALTLTSVNFFLGLAFIGFGIEKSANIFLKSILGGMILRLFIILGLVVISLKFLQINQNSFIFSVLFFYFFYLIVEIFYLNYRKS